MCGWVSLAFMMQLCSATGGGKSMTFQLPALAKGNCFTVVVGPLMALAKDQVGAVTGKSAVGSMQSVQHGFGGLPATGSAQLLLLAKWTGTACMHAHAHTTDETQARARSACRLCCVVLCCLVLHCLTRWCPALCRPLVLSNCVRWNAFRLTAVWTWA